MNGESNGCSLLQGAQKVMKKGKRLLCSKITDYIRQQSNHKGHFRANE